jgi:hypothetical protein
MLRSSWMLKRSTPGKYMRTHTHNTCSHFHSFSISYSCSCSSSFFEWGGKGGIGVVAKLLRGRATFPLTLSACRARVRAREGSASQGTDRGACLVSTLSLCPVCIWDFACESCRTFNLSSRFFSSHQLRTHPQATLWRFGARATLPSTFRSDASSKLERDIRLRGLPFHEALPSALSRALLRRPSYAEHCSHRSS